MKHQYMTVFIMIVLLTLFTPCLLEADEPDMQAPEIQILSRIEFTMLREEVEGLFQSATFLNDPQAVQNLLDYVRQDDSMQNMNAVMVVLLHMTCQPEYIIIERLETESDPWQKAKLIELLSDFYSEEVFLALLRHLDDTRTVVIPPDPDILDFQYNDLVDRVCDRAYDTLWLKLNDLKLPDFDQFDDQNLPPFPSAEQLDTLIAEFKVYWEEHNELIFEELSKQTPETVIDSITITPRPQPPELVVIEQVKALMAAGATRQEVDALFQEAAFLDSTGAVSELLFRMKKVHTSEEINPIRIVLLYMTCSPEYIMLDCLESTNPRNPDGKQDSWSQVKLMNMLRDYYDPYIFQALLAQLEDTRPVTLPPDAPPGSLGLAENQRVCDYAYNVLFSQLTALEVPGSEALEPPPDASVEEMDTLISAMQQFWDEHEDAIVEAMNTQQPETLVDRLFGSAGP